MSRAMMICMLAISLAVGVGCSAQPPRVIAQQLYDQLDQSNANHDLNQVLGFYDSSYVDTDAQRKRLAYPEWRRQLEQIFPLFRRIDPSTTVENVQLDGGRMVVYYKSEWHFEFHDQRRGWVPKILTATGKDTWERKSGQWKLVLGTTLRAKTQVDPEWTKAVRDSWDKVCGGAPCDNRH